MIQRPSHSLLSRFRQFVAEHMGLHFPLERLSDLERGLHTAAKEFGFDETEACLRWLLSAPLTRQQIEILASHLTIGETYFFRENRTFAALEEHALPELIRLRRGGEQRLRLWSAGCCSGEEAYSLAICARQAVVPLKDWHITVMGTDINPHFLRKASRGVFSEWSFRETSSGFKERYFKKVEGGSEIYPEFRQMVSFSYLNLAEDTYPSLLNNTNAVDIIICRNVLIYFTPEQAERVIRQLCHCLTDGGWLVPGLVETPLYTVAPELVPVRFPGTVLYQKQTIRTPPAPAASFIPEPLYEQALTLYEQGHYSEASETLREPAGPEPLDLPAMALLARSLGNEGKLTEALSCCNQMLDADKLNPGGHYLRASILQETGNLEEAAAAFKRVLFLDPDFILAYFSLGHLARAQGRSSESDKYFSNALALARRYPAEEVLPESEGLTAGRLAEIIASNQLTTNHDHG